MRKIIAALVGGLLLGIAGSYVAFAPDESGAPDEVVRDIVDVPKLTEAVAEQHRVEGFENLATIEEVMALPTDFARSEALYALAGRSDSGRVQNLVFEANRIADEIERVGALNILFFRLAEEDPQSALALARTEFFEGVKSAEQTVWRAWARKDLDDALFAAKAQTTVTDQNVAAQSLYAAFGFMGNATTDRIEAELGIGPDRSTRGRYLYMLADRSPAEAIGYINALGSGTVQQEQIRWLAYYLSLRDTTTAMTYADLFDKSANADLYRTMIRSNIASANPRETIERLLASGGVVRQSGEFYSAVRALAEEDLESAMQYFEQVRSTRARQVFGSQIAQALATKDPIEALAWARANEKDEYPFLEMSVLGQIAADDPQFALSEALNSESAQMRSSLVSRVIQHIAHENPQTAIAYLDQIEDDGQRAEARQALAANWIQEDPDAAVDWILSQDEQTAQTLLQGSSWMLLQSDLDSAIRLLPRVGEQHQANWRRQIASQLATTRSPAEAQAFVRQFEGEPGYAALQTSVIEGIAQSDVMLAKQLADQLSDSEARDTAYAQIIGHRAQTDPLEAARWIRTISDEHRRGAATAQLVQNWYANDPAAAMRWVDNLSAGTSRDDAIVQLASRWADPTPAQQRLIDSIEDQTRRSQAKVGQIYNMMRTDPVRARRMLDDADLPDDQRRQVEAMLNRYQGHR